MKTNRLLAILAIVAGLTAAFTKHAEHTSLYPDWKFQKERIDGKKLSFISASHMANLIYNKDADLIIFDVRKWTDYEQYHIPQALPFEAGIGSRADSRSSTIILYGDKDNDELYRLSRELPGRVYILKGGMDAWHSQVLFPDFMSFRVRNSDQLHHILRRSGFFGGKPQNSQLLNIDARESRYREGC